MSGKGEIKVEKACADTRGCFPRLIRIAPEVVTG
jgi:hypothetical protein